ncbi:MAG: AAA family ATPase, partial [Phycisphaerae bacterium]
MNGDSRLDKLLDRLEQCTGHSPTQSGKGFIARCPVATHGKGDGDRHPSLSINEGAGGRVLLKCFAGCTFDEILNALDLGVSDLLSTEKSAADEREEKETQSRVARSKNTDGYASAHEAIEALDRTIRDSRRVHEYWYENLAAQKVAAVLRYESDDGSKDFRQISKRGDRWLCKGLPRPSPIYNLPGVMNANAVFVHEGEKCCAISMALGFPSTTSMGGSNAAKGTDWSPLSGKEVVIFPDNDKPGEKFAQSVVEQLAKLQPTPTVRVVKLPGLPIAGDVCDFVKLYQGNSQDAIADINRLVSEAEHINLSFGKTVVARCLADVEEERVQWLWPGRIPLGKLTLLAGLPGSGKSTLAADLLARVSAGLPFPDAPDVVNEHGSAIVLSCEDDAADTLRPRLRIARADLRKLSVIDAVQDDGKVRGFALASDLDAIERKLQQQHDIRVILFDPLNAFTGSIDNNSEGDARSVLTPLARIAAEHNVSVIGIVHLNKSSAGMAAVHRVLGSQAWLGAARMAWLVGQDPHDDGGKVMVRLKGNLSVASGLRFRLHQPEHEQMCHVMWDDDVVDLSPEDVLNPRKTRGQDRKQAMRWLRDQ